MSGGRGIPSSPIRKVTGRNTSTSSSHVGLPVLKVWTEDVLYVSGYGVSDQTGQTALLTLMGVASLGYKSVIEPSDTPPPL